MVRRAEFTVRILSAESQPAVAVHRFLCAFLLALCCLPAAGCRRDGPERAVVTGSVTYRGEPLAEGQIRFVPASGSELPTAGAFVIAGRYTADGKGGVPVGTHKVMVEAYRIVGRAQPNEEVEQSLETALARHQFLPPKYNAKTELEITIEPGARRITKDFDLTD